MNERGFADPREPFIAYCARYSYPQVYDPKSPTMGLPKSVYELIAAFYDNGSLMIDALRGMKALRVGRYHILPESEAQDLPDYFEHAEENKAPRGRGLGALKLDGSLGFGDELMGQLKAKLDELQVPVLFSHRVNRLLLNSRGEAIGVEATHGDKTVSIRARRAVIFGTGVRGEVSGVRVAGPRFSFRTPANRMLAGFKSRWTMPRSCAYWTA